MTTRQRISLLQRCGRTKFQFTWRTWVSTAQICVSTANEKRAKEIVREIVEGAPPE